MNYARKLILAFAHNLNSRLVERWWSDNPVAAIWQTIHSRWSQSCESIYITNISILGITDWCHDDTHDTNWWSDNPVAAIRQTIHSRWSQSCELIYQQYKHLVSSMYPIIWCYLWY